MNQPVKIGEVFEGQHRHSIIPTARERLTHVFSIPKIEIYVYSEKWVKFIMVYRGETSHATTKFIRRQCAFNKRSKDATMQNIRYVTTDIRGTRKEHYSTELLIAIK